jgi:hypothetical protein
VKTLRKTRSVRRLVVVGLVVGLFASGATVQVRALQLLNLPLQITRIAPASARAGESVVLTVPITVPLAPGLAVTARGRPASVVRRGLDTITVRLPSDLLAGHAILRVASQLHSPGERAMTVIPSSPLYDGTIAVVPDESKRETALIGALGGTVQSAGMALDVPAGALSDTASISITPLISAGGAPLQFVAGARFEPDGLTFAQPALLTFSGANLPQRLMGFAFDGDGTGLRVRPIARFEGGARLEVEHFSEEVLGTVREENFRRLAEPLVAGAFPLSVGLIDHLIDLVDRWEALFGPGFCNRTTACRDALFQITRSAYVGIDNACLAGRQNPLQGLTAISQISDFQAVLAKINDPGGLIRPFRGEACQQVLMSTLIEEAGRRALSNPLDTRIQELMDLAAKSAGLSFDDLDKRARSLAGQAVDRIIDVAVPRCDGGDAEELAAERELIRALTWSATGVRTTKPEEEIRRLIDACGLQIAIANAGQLVAVPGVPVNVRALITHSDSQGVAWSTDGGSISASGLTATFQDSAIGTRNLSARSVANPNKSAQSPIEVVDDAFVLGASCRRPNSFNHVPIVIRRIESHNPNVLDEDLSQDPPFFTHFGGGNYFTAGGSPGHTSISLVPTAKVNGQVMEGPSASHIRIDFDLSRERDASGNSIDVYAIQVFAGNGESVGKWASRGGTITESNVGCN